MTKKVLLLFAVIIMSVACPAIAQNAVGDWRIHNTYVGTDVTAVAETNRWVYYLAGGNLFRLDKETEENEALSIVNELSDIGIKQIYYNSDRDYIVVIYNNSDIDIIQSKGGVVNMPEIKNAVMTTSKSINDVTFGDGVIYLAADFGYAVIDDHKFVIKESHQYGVPIVSVAQVGNKLLLSTADSFYWGDADKYHDQLSSFTLTNFRSNCRIWPINNEAFFCMTGWTFLGSMKIDEAGNVKLNSRTIIESKTSYVQKTKGGYLMNVPLQGKCYKTDENGEVVETIETPDEKCSANPNGDGQLWAAGAKGLHQLVRDNYYLPNALSFNNPFWMTYNKGKDMLYVSNPAANGFFSTTPASRINTYDGIKWKNVTPLNAPKDGSYWIEFLPDDPNTYFMGTWRRGLLKVVNDEIVMEYDSVNSLLKKSYSIHPVTSIDRYGNVWVAQTFENKENYVIVLPAAKAKLNQSTKQDWIKVNIDGIYTGNSQRASFLSTRYSNYDIKIYTDGDFQKPIFIWNSGGDISTHPENVSFTKLTDQDGLSIGWTYIVCLAEDLSGTVWMGTSEGIVSFNPAKAFSGDFRVNHIKVPRNDGTGMADYLLDGIQVNGIAVDGANRKWIATQNSGLFLVSADGTQIINKFNSTNSPLASNTVYKVCCNPNSNSVFVTTPEGLYEYFSDSSPAEPNYDNIYAYPNPVRPEYGGNVTITGMMDNSLIKIADASGNVIRQLKSTGGMATWDCCDQYGERVKTGVYMVLCSRANGNGEAVVTKIAVIR